MATPTIESLITFEKELEELYEAGKIHSPVHFSRGNEESLINIFKDVLPGDWVFSTHRSHYHALLKGINPEWLKNEILNDKSMHINSAEDKFFTSSIVGGALAIATGVALALQRQDSKDRVWCFTGDMASETGMFHECIKYSAGYSLPITFIVEDNGMSVKTPTYKVWARGNLWYMRYEYEKTVPHHGTGKWVNF